MRTRSLFAVPALAGLALLAVRLAPGPQPDGTTLLPSGWRIRPAGRLVGVGTLPLNLVTLSDGSLLVSNDGYGANGLMRIDPVSGNVVWQTALRAAWLGLARAGGDWRDTVWASGAGTNRLYRLAWQGGMTWTTDTVALADTSARVYPAGIALVPRRGLVAVVGNLSDSVYAIDAATLARRGAVAVGHRPYTVVADSTHLYVSNWGDSTVSVVDATTPASNPATIFVGPHPSALALSGSDLYVALAGANRVARVDLRTGSVAEQVTLELAAQAPTGSDPNALAVTADGRSVYVALAGANAIAVLHRSRTGLRVAGFIPAGWYPTAVTLSADGRTLFVANGKGGGSHANPDGRYIGAVITGSVAIVPVPDSAALARYTRQVYALSPYSNPRVRSIPPDRLDPAPPVHHVVYIVRENRTYDQVFGDVAGANGDPSLALFNDSVTPNAHALAHRFVLFDNFYCSGEVSADGHEWTDRAFAGDYNEKTWPQNYSRRRPWDFDDGDDLADPHGAYLWDAARKKGLWVVNFGERSETDSGPAGWGPTHSPLSGLGDITVPGYPAFRLEIADTTRARLFGDSVASWDAQGRFPDLVFVWLPRDHTYGRSGGRPTPRSMVADNDLALGQIVERLSQSPAWASLAVFVLEDDAQNGPDHVDAHRSVLLVASPFAKSGVVDSTFYTTASVVRSIGVLLGLPPLSQYDAAATPLWGAFAGRPNPTPFTHVPNRWPLDQLNPHAARSAIPAGDFAVADRADEVVLNREIWQSVHPGAPVPAVRHGRVWARAGR
jgi:YVTN family beta-propeller protein